MTATVLFVCTGNYYRSRYAEHFFNEHARQRKLDWKASSRGLQPSLENLGCMSRHALDRLRKHGFGPRKPVRLPMDLQASDLMAAALTIAMNEIEHRPLMAARFPEWEECVRYWRMYDLDLADAESGLAAIENAVLALLDELSAL
ncbi:MAG: low molecular weight phosphatase family protein [Caldilineaceae bacterium SB0661_bin_32]|uniref:Low molecular weight phosphatase family protein n=1 Tax=Caldilineaceae bacterium SB0661_bin_32 TaxID=2605255 RepID=A0A6B1D495_9CHLR|nr:low molecular weight phosphatase family protein [Caldilineaceae bacterium SB0661_bin_32]